MPERGSTEPAFETSRADQMPRGTATAVAVAGGELPAKPAQEEITRRLQCGTRFWRPWKMPDSTCWLHNLEEAEWSVRGIEVSVKVAMSQVLIDIALGPEPKRIIQAALNKVANGR